MLDTIRQRVEKANKAILSNSEKFQEVAVGKWKEVRDQVSTQYSRGVHEIGDLVQNTANRLNWPLASKDDLKQITRKVENLKGKIVHLEEQVVALKSKSSTAKKSSSKKTAASSAASKKQS